VERKQGDSHFWASLVKVKYDFLRFGSISQLPLSLHDNRHYSIHFPTA